jgi:hypothetical protein
VEQGGGGYNTNNNDNSGYNSGKSAVSEGDEAGGEAGCDDDRRLNMHEGTTAVTDTAYGTEDSSGAAVGGLMAPNDQARVFFDDDREVTVLSLMGRTDTVVTVLQRIDHAADRECNGQIVKRTDSETDR